MPIFAAEIDGHGEVGETLSVTGAEGFADGTFSLTMSTRHPAAEIGAMCYLDSVGVVADGWYTFTRRTVGKCWFVADPADVTVGATIVTGSSRIDDHYRISDGIPSWVTGANAVARWFPYLQGVTETAGQRVDPTGGVAKVDGVELTTSYLRNGLEAIRRTTYREDTTGPCTLADPMTGSTTTLVSVSSAVYSGGGTSAPTTAQPPVWVGTEAVDSRTTASTSTSGAVTEYTHTVTRGVLRTLARPHAEGTAIFAGMPSVTGRTGRAYLYPNSAGSHADRHQTFRGVIESFVLERKGRLQRMRIAAGLLAVHRDVVPRVVTARRGDGSVGPDTNYLIRQSRQSLVTWLDIEGRVMGRVERVRSFGDYDGREEWLYTGFGEITTRSDLPLIKAMSGAEYARATGPARSTFGLADDRLIIYVGPTGSETFITNTEIIESAVVGHLFEPIRWPRSRNDDIAGAGWVVTERLMEVNPIDALICVLTSTGTDELNGEWDKAPAELSLGIAYTSLDIDSFTEVGDKFAADGVTAGTVWLSTRSSDPLAKFIGALCETYCLALVTTKAGLIRLVDLSVLDPVGAVTLGESDLVAAPDDPYDVDPAKVPTSVAIQFNKPWINGARSPNKVTTRASVATDGMLEHVAELAGKELSIDCPFSASVDESSDGALAVLWGAYLKIQRGVSARLEVDVLPTWAGDVGDTVSVTLPTLPNAAGDGPMTAALARVVDRVSMIRPIGRASDGVTLEVYGYSADELTERNWSASGVVASASSSTDFDLEASNYNGVASSDAESFQSGDRIHIYEADWTLRTDTAGVVDTASGNNITLSSAAESSGSPVTPNAGDKIALSNESDQTTARAATEMWQSSTVPGNQWQ